MTTRIPESCSVPCWSSTAIASRSRKTAHPVSSSHVPSVRMSYSSTSGCLLSTATRSADNSAAILASPSPSLRSPAIVSLLTAAVAQRRGSTLTSSSPPRLKRSVTFSHNERDPWRESEGSKPVLRRDGRRHPHHDVAAHRAGPEARREHQQGPVDDPVVHGVVQREWNRRRRGLVGLVGHHEVDRLEEGARAPVGIGERAHLGTVHGDAVVE